MEFFVGTTLLSLDHYTRQCLSLFAPLGDQLAEHPYVWMGIQSEDNRQGDRASKKQRAQLIRKQAQYRENRQPIQEYDER